MAWLNPIYFWAFIAVPLVIGLFLLAAWRRRELIQRFGDKSLFQQLAAGVSTRRRRWKAGLVVLAVALVVLSLVGPRYGTQLREVKREGIDLIFALDVSLSMQAEDVAPSRLERAKNEIKKVLDELRGDRVGLIVFAGDAFIQCPLTTDYSAVRLFLDVASPDQIPTPGTDFSAALQTAVQAFDTEGETEVDQRTRALVFVSDGENHVEGIDTILGEARESGIVIFASGVGEPDGAPIPLYRNGRQVGYKQDRDGRVVSTKLEETALQQLAEDGAYFRVAKTSSSMLSLIPALERLEKVEFGAEEFEEYEEQYQWPLLVAILLLAGERLVSDRRKKTASSTVASEAA
ncbi:MAG: VWA domain-containing protein [Rhodothermales bacterium]